MHHHLDLFPDADKTLSSAADWVAALGNTFSRVNKDGITCVVAATDEDLDLKLEVFGTKVGSAVRTGSVAS